MSEFMAISLFSYCHNIAVEQIIHKVREGAIRMTGADDVSVDQLRESALLSLHCLTKAVVARWPSSDCSWVGHASLAKCVDRMTGSFRFSQGFLNLGVAGPFQYTSQSWEKAGMVGHLI